MKRREFITLAGGAAAWPVVARAQQVPIPVIGFLSPNTPEGGAYIASAFRHGLSDKGFVEGKNVKIEYRWARNEDNRLPELAADLVSQRVAIIATPGNSRAALAAKAASSTIPIVFSIGGDPVQAGLVSAYDRPGGNVTGISSLNTELSAKRIGLLHELAPSARRVAVLTNPRNPATDLILSEVRSAVSAIGLQFEAIEVLNPSDIDTVFARLAEKGADSLLVPPGWPYSERRTQIITLAARHAVPTMYAVREYTDLGGLMSYGPNVADEFRQAGIYVGRILNGEKPVNLPIMRPTKFEFVINMQTARALDFVVSPGLLAIADEVIE